jgi:TRAP-type uncharacterized transport system substrate-binding protein
MKSTLALAGLLAVVHLQPVSAQQLTVGTATPGSLFHSAGTAVSSVLTEKAGMRVTLQPFASANVYIPAISEGDIDLGVGTAHEVGVALEGLEHFEKRPQKGLRAIGVMFPLRFGVFVRADSKIKSLGDLKGKTVPDFAAGRVDAFFFALGAAKVREVDAAVGGLRLLPFKNTKEELTAVRQYLPQAYFREEQPSKANPGVNEAAMVLAIDAVAFGSAKTADDAIYKVTKTLYENKDALAAAFPAYRGFEPKDMARQLDPIEYHPGSVRFYKEAGIWGGK